MDVWRIALPACLAFVTEPVAGIVHTAVIGRLGEAGPLAGTSLGAVAFNSMLALAFFLRFGTAGLTAQAIGARDPKEGLLHLARATVFAALLGFAVLLLQGPIFQALDMWLSPPAGASQSFNEYYAIRIWSVPFALFNYVLLGWLYGRARSGTGLFLQSIINATNIILSIVFVTYLGLGPAGLAAAILIGQAAAALCGYGLVLRHYGGARRIITMLPIKAIADLPEVRRMIALSRDLTIRSIALSFAMAYFAAQAGRLGDTALASTGVLLQLVAFASFVLDGLAIAVEQLSGRAVGANWRPAFVRSIRLGFGWGVVIGTVLFAVMIGFGGPVIDVMTTSPEVRSDARGELLLVALISLTGMPAYVYDGVMIGATLNWIMRNGMLISLACFLVAAWYFEPLFGLPGLWLALHVMLVVRAVVYALWIRAHMDRLFDPPP